VNTADVRARGLAHQLLFRFQRTLGFKQQLGKIEMRIEQSVSEAMAAYREFAFRMNNLR